ncbi:MAG: M28 family peptidase [candidate division KSB1 bacterium]|nr:M28 family peptidase [candidate division KSB1 bacterium]
MWRHLEILGSDSLQGRGTGSPGIRKAANYISSRLRKYGIPPADAVGSYFQRVPMHGSMPLADSKLVCMTSDTSVSLLLQKDYLLYKTGAQTIIPQPLPLVFVGYGIIAPEYDYNDYQSLDIEGKIVVFLSGEPPSSDPAFFNAEEPTIYSYPESKHRIAISRGARGSIMIPLARDANSRTWPEWIMTFSFEDITLAYAVSSNLSIVINPEIADLFFENSGYSLSQVLEMDVNHRMRSFSLVTRISFRGEFIERDFQDANVIGMKKGRSDRAVILSAHYDHLGIGPPVRGDSIYNGVNDNATGVAALLEIARIFSEIPAPYNSLVFLFTSGEEKGLLGATYYVDHPVVPLYRTIANINIDGLAIFDQFETVVGVGADLSTLGQELERTAALSGLDVSPIPSRFLATESFARSDQIAFAKAGVPSILIAEGLDYKNISSDQGLRLMTHWMDTIYHTPFDDLSQPLNMKAATQHCRFIFTYSHLLAQLKDYPEWKPGTPFINARLLSFAEKR